MNKKIIFFVLLFLGIVLKVYTQSNPRCSPFDLATTSSSGQIIGLQPFSVVSSGGVIEPSKKFFNRYTFPAGVINDAYVWVNVGTGHAAMALYANSAGAPTTAIWCSASIPVTGDGYQHFSTGGVTITAGDYWLGACSDLQLYLFSGGPVSFAEDLVSSIDECSAAGTSAELFQVYAYAVVY